MGATSRTERERRRLQLDIAAALIRRDRERALAKRLKRLGVQSLPAKSFAEMLAEERAMRRARQARTLRALR